MGHAVQCQCQHFTNDMLSPCWPQPHQVAIVTIYWLLLTFSSMISTLSLKCVKDSGLKISACSSPWWLKALHHNNTVSELSSWWGSRRENLWQIPAPALNVAKSVQWLLGGLWTMPVHGITFYISRVLQSQPARPWSANKICWDWSESEIFWNCGQNRRWFSKCTDSGWSRLSVFIIKLHN